MGPVVDAHTADLQNQRVDAPTGIISALITGVVIGVLGRVVVPSSRRAPIGCLMTILLGLLGAALGLVVASGIDANRIVTVLLQVAIAAVLVFLVSAAGARGDGRGPNYRSGRGRGRP